VLSIHCKRVILTIISIHNLVQYRPIAFQDPPIHYHTIRCILLLLFVFTALASLPFSDVRLPAVIVLLGVAGYTLGSALPAKGAPTARAVVETSNRRKVPVKAPATTAKKARASTTQSGSYAAITIRPFNSKVFSLTHNCIYIVFNILCSGSDRESPS
jgi:hypothetical protein